MTRQTYVLSAALAASLGVNTVLVSGGVSPVQAIEAPRYERVVVELTPEQQSTVYALAQDVACNAVDAKYELAGEAACLLSRDLRGRISVGLDRDGRHVLEARLLVAGSWVPGSPQ